MIGLPNNIQVNAINQWRQLFYKKINYCSIKAYESWKNVENIGLSNYKNNDWKYFPLKEFLINNFIGIQQKEIDFSKYENLGLNLDSYKLIFVNGYLISKLDNYNNDPWKIQIQRNINCQSLPKPIKSDFFLHLIESLSNEITIIFLKKNKISSKPLYLLHINQGSNFEKSLTTISYRHHIILDDYAQGEVIEHHISLDNKGCFNGIRTSIVLRNNASLIYTKISFENDISYHISNNDISLGKNANINSNNFILGSKFSFNKFNTQLNNKKSNLSINSLSIALKNNMHDITSYLEHNNSCCYSNQLHKMIVGNYGKSMFNGLIKVSKKASKIDGKMINKNLLIDETSKIYTKPKLEIYNDDVKCNHSATTGHIDYDQIFYLCSRGIKFKYAKKIIIKAFTNELIELIHNDQLKDILLDKITDILQEISI